jgi:hypothetical protein
MGVETAMLATAGGTALAGAVKGAKGTPEVQQFQDATTSNKTDQTQRQQTTFAPATEQERQLQQQSLQNYLAQQDLINQGQQRVAQYDPLRQAAMDQTQAILSGQATQVTPQEQMQLDNLRQALVAQGTSDIQQFQDQGLRQALSAAGSRGLRGQALGELQGRVLQEGTRQYGALQNQANQMVAQQTLQLPYQRIAAQQPFLQQGLTLQDQLSQQAIQNRQLAQNPYLLSLLNQNRLAAGTTTSTNRGTTTGTQRGVNTTPAQAGSVSDAILGGLGGAAAGASAAGNIYGGIQNYGLTSDLRSQLQQQQYQPTIQQAASLPSFNYRSSLLGS